MFTAYPRLHRRLLRQSLALLAALALVTFLALLDRAEDVARLAALPLR
jgi:hypothetical protein